MAEVDTDAIRNFAKHCEDVASYIHRYGDTISGGNFGHSDGLFGNEPKPSSTDTTGSDKIADDASYSDGFEFTGFRVTFIANPSGGDPMAQWRESYSGPNDVSVQGGDIAPWALPLIHEWNIGIQGRITDLERAFEEVSKMGPKLKDIADNWDDADEASAAEIASKNEDVDWHDREWDK